MESIPTDIMTNKIAQYPETTRFNQLGNHSKDAIKFTTMTIVFGNLLLPTSVLLINRIEITTVERFHESRNSPLHLI